MALRPLSTMSSVPTSTINWPWSSATGNIEITGQDFAWLHDNYEFTWVNPLKQSSLEETDVLCPSSSLITRFTCWATYRRAWSGVRSNFALPNQDVDRCLCDSLLTLRRCLHSLGFFPRSWDLGIDNWNLGVLSSNLGIFTCTQAIKICMYFKAFNSCRQPFFYGYCSLTSLLI